MSSPPAQTWSPQWKTFWRWFRPGRCTQHCACGYGHGKFPGRAVERVPAGCQCTHANGDSGRGLLGLPTAPQPFWLFRELRKCVG